MHPYQLHRNDLTQHKPKAAVPHQTTPKRAGYFLRWMRTVGRRWQRRKMIATLQAMDDRLLRDMGIHRGDIEHVVDGFDERELRMSPRAPATAPRPERFEQAMTVPFNWLIDRRF